VPTPDSTLKSLLVIGGNSSIAPAIFENALKSSYIVSATTRRFSKAKTENQVFWIPLDLSNKKSTSQFIKKIEGQKFDRIICLVGGVTGSDGSKLSIEFLQNYYLTFVSNLFFIIQELLSHLKKESNMIVLSSRAVNSKSFDFHYAATKGALESFIKSFSEKFNEDRSLVAVRSGLITGSKMFTDMQDSIRLKHYIKSNHKLISVEKICDEIWNLTPKKTKKLNGEVIIIGPEY
jgi:NAD(P)-dependent dehydrogenase (short-subunit alcohol dehydrogenase family)